LTPVTNSSSGSVRSEVPADRAAVADLRAADGARRLREGAQRRLHRLRVRQAGAQPDPSVLARPAAQLGDLVQIQERGRPRAVEVELDHHVRSALNRDGGRLLGLQP
jgi:hypothetical protein